MRITLFSTEEKKRFPKNETRLAYLIFRPAEHSASVFFNIPVISVVRSINCSVTQITCKANVRLTKLFLRFLANFMRAVKSRNAECELFFEPGDQRRSHLLKSVVYRQLWVTISVMSQYRIEQQFQVRTSHSVNSSYTLQRKATTGMITVFFFCYQLDANCFYQGCLVLETRFSIVLISLVLRRFQSYLRLLNQTS